MSDSRIFIIIGAGQAGGWLARTLRTEGFKGRVVLVGEEPYYPYERPPLSKSTLLDNNDISSTYFWPPEAYHEFDIEVLLDRRAVTIDRDSKQISLDSGDVLPYDRLAITTGTRPRLLPVDGIELNGIHYLRNMDHALAIRNDVKPGSTVLVVGGGWIGLELAATLSTLGCKLIIVEATNRLCARAVTPDMSDWMLKLHQQHGAEIVLETGIDRFMGSVRVEGALLSTGETINCTSAVIGIGVIPNTEIASAAGINVENGIIVDEFCCTSDPDIFAAGDVTNQPTIHSGRIRLESWENAQNQGIAAGKSMLNIEQPHAEIPWFWSDQYEANIQMIGIPKDWDEIAKRQHSESMFLTMYLKDDMIVGAIAVNNARELRIAKRLMQSGKTIPVEHLTNTDIKMQTLLKA